MINGKEPNPFISCPFRMMSDILDNCKKGGCAWWDKEKQQCIIRTIADAVTELRGESKC